MTIEEYLDMPADKLEKMSDAELLEHFKQYLPTTRPESARKAAGTPTQRTMTQGELPKFTPQQLANLQKMEAAGVDVSFMYQRMKRK